MVLACSRLSVGTIEPRNFEHVELSRDTKNTISTTAQRRLHSACFVVFVLFSPSPYFKGRMSSSARIEERKELWGCCIIRLALPVSRLFTDNLERRHFRPQCCWFQVPTTWPNNTGKRIERRLEPRQTGYFRRVLGTVSVTHNTSWKPTRFSSASYQQKLAELHLCRFSSLTRGDSIRRTIFHDSIPDACLFLITHAAKLSKQH